MSKTITHSLLDRLIDNEPDQAVEAAETDAQALHRYKIALRSDLEALLNGKRPDFEAFDRYPALDQTIIGFGLHDISTEDLSTNGARERVRRMVAQAVMAHESRLTQVEVDMDESPTSSGIRLRISAQLTLTRNRDVVVYEAKVNPGDRVIQVDLK